MKLTRFLLVSVFTAALCTASAAQQDDDAPSAENNTARLQVKLSQFEEQIRRMQGTIEQLGYENKQLKAQMEKQNSDIEFRLSEIEKKQTAAPQQAAEAPAQDSGTLHPVESEEPTKAEPQQKAKRAVTPKFISSREHYNYAFKLLNQAKYPEAGAAFDDFVQLYPKDPLIGNAFYWLGETYYVRRDYVHAADDFRQGYEAMPTGPKAPDNLLKLSLSLNALKKDKEACVVLKQIVVKFGTSSPSMKMRAEQEMNAFNCN